MNVSVYYAGKTWRNLEGNTVEELFENNFGLFTNTIRQYAGNVAGHELDRVWLTRKNKEICELHVIAHGDDHLINYDARTEDRKELTFEVKGIPEDQFGFDSAFEVELVEPKKFDPFDESLLKELHTAVGVLEGCIDYLAESVHNDSLHYRVEEKFPTAKKCKASLYISQLMFRFSLLSIKKTAKTEDVFELIGKVTDVLPELIEQNKEKIKDTTLIYYHTLCYFEKRGKITALKHYRTESGKTQGEVADAVGISLRQYQRYESVDSALGHANRAVIEKIAETVGVKASDIVKNDVVVLK